jgi:hypothetical protein
MLGIAQIVALCVARSERGDRCRTAEGQQGRETSGLSLSYRYHAGMRLRTSEYFHWKGFGCFLMQPDIA